MSDDTPTQRFPEQGDSAAEGITTGEIQRDLKDEKQRSRGLLIGLIVAGALLLIALVVLILFLLTNNASGEDGTALPTPVGTSGPSIEPTPEVTPSSEPTPEETPSSEPDEPDEPQQPSTAVSIDSFNVSNKTVYCNTQAPGGPFNQYISFSWKTSNADSISIGTYDPYGDYSGYYYNLPPDGNTSDMGLEITYGCPEASQKWRLEVTGNGQTIKQEIKIVNAGDTQ